MDASASKPSSFPGDTIDASPHPGRDGPPPSPERHYLAVVAKRRTMKADAIDSPVRRSPHLSCLLPPPPPIECQATQDRGENSDDSVNDVILHLSRDETPENDDLPPDEPSSVLASRIMRAHDNPSPPPQDRAYPSVDLAPRSDGQFPLADISVPPSPFRPINLLERLNPLSDSRHSARALSQVIRPHTTQPDTTSSCGFVSSESSSPSANDRLPADPVPSPSNQCAVDNLHPRSQHPAAGLLAQSITITSSPESEILISPPEQVVDPSLDPVVPSTSDDPPRQLSSCSERRQSVNKSSALAIHAETLSLPSSNENGVVPPPSQTTVLCGQDNDGEDTLSVDKNSSPSSKAGKEGNTKEVDINSLQRSSISIKHQSAILPRTPTPCMRRPDFSRTSVQRPIVTSTPVRANNVRKLGSPSKISFEVDDIHRTPAQRVPIETAFSRGTSSFRRATQLSTDQSRSSHFLTIRAPVFTRPALDDVSRSPAKRVPIANLAVSPTRLHEAQTFPQVGLRARSASVESRHSGTTLARSRSVEPCGTISKPDNCGKVNDPTFPVAPALPRPGTKLPFPLVPCQKSSDGLPPSVPEEYENADAGKPETDATLLAIAINMTSQLRQPSSSSRIPRIGSKPYARPPKTGKAALSTTTTNNARAPRAPSFQLPCRDSGTGNNSTGVSPKLASDHRLVGSLKRKRGAEVAAPSNSHPVIIRQVVPGILSEKYAPKPVKLSSQAQVPLESGQPKVPQPLKFRKVVDGMLSGRYVPAKANLPETESKDCIPLSPPLSELSSLSDEGTSDEKLPPTADTPRTDDPPVESSTPEYSLHQDTDDRPSSRPRRTSRTRKPAQQQYVLDLFNSNASTRLLPARRKSQFRTEGDYFMGMNATALRALTTSNTTKNQQTVAVLATEVIRKEGLRPESPTVKARTILQKQRDERDTRRRERAQKRAQTNGENLGDRDAEGQSELEDSESLGAHDESDVVMSQKHPRGPGDEEDYETPGRPGRIEPLRLEGVNIKVKPVKQVKWHRGLSTVVYLDEVNPKPKSFAKDVVVIGCLAPTSKNLPLDPLGNLVGSNNRPSPELVTEHIVVKRYLYDNDVEPEPVPAKMTRSKSKKNKS